MTRDEMIAALIAGGLDDEEHLDTLTDDELRECVDEMRRQTRD
jgi:hypothetical protein